jgi:glucose/arabinose dehydrogenase
VRALFAALVAGAAVAVPAAGVPVGIQVPAGFRVETFATGLTQPTAMAYGPDGRIYVTQTSGTLVAIRRGATRPQVLVRKLRTPLGLAWRGRTLFVSEQGLLERLNLRGGGFVGRHVVFKGLPFGRHQQDNVAFGGDGRLYWGSGSTCDACRERSARTATILSLRPDGSDLRIYARGLRNRTASPSSPAPVASTRRSTARTSSAPQRTRSRPRWSWSSAEARSTAGLAAGRTRGRSA